MKSILIALLGSIFLLSAANSPGSEPLRHLRIFDSNSRLIAQDLEDQGFDVLEGSVKAEHFDVIATVQELESLRANGFNPEIIAIGRPFREIQAERQAGLEVPIGYPDLAGILALMNATAESYPSICQVIDLTETYSTAPTAEGRHIFAMKISDNVLLDEDEPAFLMVGNHHAREIVTPLLALHAIENLTTQYGVDNAITAVVNNNEIWIAPVWNQDGYEYVFNTDNMWRKNRQVFSGGIGVDLNRNYPHGWDNACSGDTYPSSNIYKGPSAGSEPATQTMMAWSLDRRFTRVIDFHSSGREVLHGYDCWNYPFDEYLEEQAINLSNAAGYEGDHRSPSADGEHYQWQFAQMSALAFLVETHTEFQPTYLSALSEADQIWPASWWLLTKPSPWRGYVTDAVSGEPISASISFPDILFENGETCISSQRFGRYQAWFPNGTYDALVSADGYEPVSLSDIVVHSAFPRRMDVAMTRIASAVQDGQAGQDDLSVTINSAMGLLSYEITRPSQVSLEVYDLRGALVRTLVHEFQSSGFYEIPVPTRNDKGQALASGVFFYRITAGDEMRSGKMVLVR